MAADMGVPILGQIPIDPEMVDSGDRGDLKGMTDKPDLKINAARPADRYNIVPGEVPRIGRHDRHLHCYPEIFLDTYPLISLRFLTVNL